MPDLVAVETTRLMSELHVTRMLVPHHSGPNGRRARNSAAVETNHVHACVMAVVRLVATSRVSSAISRHAVRHDFVKLVAQCSCLEWKTWTAWSMCDATACGEAGSQKRSREVKL